MKKRTRCLHDSVCPFRDMSPPENGIYSYHTEARPLFDRVFRRGRQRQYQQVAQVPAPWIAQPQMPMPAQSREQHTGALNTGESVYRTLDPVSDVNVPTQLAMRGAMFVTGLTISIIGWAKWPSPFWLVGVVFCTFSGGIYFVVNRKAILQDDEFFKVHTRDAENTSTEPVTGKYKASGEIKEGQKTIYTEFDIADPVAWHNFCIDVHSGKNFSLRVARDNGMNDTEFYRIVELWKSEDPQKALIDPSTVGERKTIKPTRMGGRMIKLFAEHPPTLNE